MTLVKEMQFWLHGHLGTGNESSSKETTCLRVGDLYKYLGLLLCMSGRQRPQTPTSITSKKKRCLQEEEENGWGVLGRGRSRGKGRVLCGWRRVPGPPWIHGQEALFPLQSPPATCNGSGPWGRAEGSPGHPYLPGTCLACSKFESVRTCYLLALVTGSGAGSQSWERFSLCVLENKA